MKATSFLEDDEFEETFENMSKEEPIHIKMD